MSEVRAGLIAPLVFAIVLAATGLGNASTSVSIQPSVLCVEQDEVFNIFVWKDSADLEFDGYQTVITFDPEMLELMSAGEEYVMTDSCWNRWWFPDPGPDSIFVSHVLMCGGVTVTGPGALSSLTFRALAEGITTITCDYFWLTYQGYRLDDIAWHDGMVNVGMAGVNGRSGTGGELRIEAYPNPGRFFRIRLAGVRESGVSIGDGTLDICDIGGKVVETLSCGKPGGLTEGFSWNGSRADGGTAAPGVYFVRFASGSKSINHKVILLK
jgi:hypothetical protein